MSRDLPPGVSVSDIPGNRPEDEEFDWLIGEIFSSMEEEGLTCDDARNVWAIAVGLYKLFRQNVKKGSHR